MSTDDELKRLFQEAEPARAPGDPDALVDSLMARIEAAQAAASGGPDDAGSGDDGPGAEGAGDPGPDAVGPRASHAGGAGARRGAWWRTALAVAGAIGIGVVGGALLRSCIADPGALPTISATATEVPSPAASPSPSPSPSPTPSPSPSPSPAPSPSPSPGASAEPPRSPLPADTSAPRIALSGMIVDVWEQNDVCGPHQLALVATITDDVGVAASGLTYTAGSAAPQDRAMTPQGGDTYTGQFGPIAPDSVPHDLSPTDVTVTVWASDAAGNTSSIQAVVPVRSAWACAPG